MTRIIHYFKDTVAEMQRVSWPTQKQALIYSALVIAVSAIVALLLSGFDFIFTRLLEFVV